MYPNNSSPRHAGQNTCNMCWFPKNTTIHALPPRDDDANLVGLLHSREAVRHDDHRHALLRHQIVDGNPKLPSGKHTKSY